MKDLRNRSSNSKTNAIRLQASARHKYLRKGSRWERWLLKKTKKIPWSQKTKASRRNISPSCSRSHSEEQHFSLRRALPCKAPLKTFFLLLQSRLCRPGWLIRFQGGNESNLQQRWKEKEGKGGLFRTTPPSAEAWSWDITRADNICTEGHGADYYKLFTIQKLLWCIA